MQLLKTIANILNPLEERGQLVEREGKQFIKLRDICWETENSHVKCELAIPATQDYYSHNQYAIVDVKAIISVRPK